MERLEDMRKYIMSLGLTDSSGHQLTEHVAHTVHEDVPSDDEPSTEVIPFDPKIPARLQPTLPPINFGAVVKNNIYRSGYPSAENFGFLKSLKLKTILTLVPEPIPEGYRTFMTSHGIQHFHVHIPANKGKVRIAACEMTRALEIVLDRSNHPLLIHCNKGKHRTGCVVGCFRRVEGEEFGPIFDEYHTYANPKARLLDEAFIELFDEHTVMWMARRYNWVQPVAAEPLPPSPPSPVPTLSVAKPRA
ncbi:hypothetical protein BU24DRAFT_479522 [Aaosphaeria arxii CBS 175.79]|uniref:diphosphoinositol-polyphosphate diphosphatase n=1 Tax=Aaosphaeria arxii CBS 175.79 TaxID=1450172 RepID=A0A6A5XYV3_9PLEO|nr:uncharacterized protein BU24DRAFT_479522 [Aaosphaeria arxii CBS 175.79]KAF2018149.1 hypothetical protein BU24DRAFT_479522 [Aaosphaeria arxii CBS 175.79]